MCLLCFVLFRLCIFILICLVCTSIRTTATEWQRNCSNNNNNNNNEWAIFGLCHNCVQWAKWTLNWDRVRRLNRKRFCLVCGMCPVQIWPGQGTLLTEECSNLSQFLPVTAGIVPWKCVDFTCACKLTWRGHPLSSSDDKRGVLPLEWCLNMTHVSPMKD